MSFANCINAYANSDHLARGGIIGHSVAFPELAAFDDARRRLIKKIKEEVIHESWEDGLKLFNTIHAKLARTPCRPSWLIHEILEIREGSHIIKNLERRLSNVDPGVQNIFQDLNQRLEILRNIETSPLLGPLKDSRLSNGITLFILRDLRLWEEVRSCLAEVVKCHSWELVKPSSLRNQHYADRLFIFGPAWYLSYRNEDYLLRAPSANEINLVACAHEFTGDVRLSLLSEKDNIQISGRRKAQPSEAPWHFEPIAPAERGRFRFKGSVESRIWASGKKVTAIPFRFGGSLGTYFAKDSNVWVVTSDCTGTSPVCTGVDKIPVDELEPGALVLMTTSGGGDMIPVVADMILPRSSQIRSLQLTWKSALRNLLELDGLHVVTTKLKALGAQKASPSNLRNWCNPRSLGMENLETDLRAVLKLISMEERYNDVVAGIEALRSSHQSAGVQLQKKLRESLQGQDLSEVFRLGQLEIRHHDGPAKTVFLVEERGEEDEIPEEWEGELMEIDD